MARQHHTPEQIISKLREAEVELGRGATVPLVCKRLGITEGTYDNICYGTNRTGFFNRE